MKNRILKFAVPFLVAVVLVSCNREDPGALQQDSRSFDVKGFDNLSVGAAMDVTVTFGPEFSFVASGDRRNLDDLSVSLNGPQLEVKYRSNKSHEYTTYLTVVMPEFKGADFSGAVNARVSGFTADTPSTNINVTGASKTQFEIATDQLNLEVSGASEATVSGSGRKISAIISGASQLQTLNFPVDQVKLNVSGASHARVSAALQLNGTVSGASEVIYRGDPLVNVGVSGASSVSKE